MNNQQWLFANKMIQAAYEAKKLTQLPASIVSSQAILETGWGKSIPICRKTKKYSYNLFGIKGKGTNGSVEIWTHEYINYEKVKVIAEFRAYNNYSESFIDYGNLILGKKRYKNAVINKNDPEKYIREIWKAGYATDPKYPEKILRIARQCKFIK